MTTVTNGTTQPVPAATTTLSNNRRQSSAVAVRDTQRDTLSEASHQLCFQLYLMAELDDGYWCRGANVTSHVTRL